MTISLLEAKETHPIIGWVSVPNSIQQTEATMYKTKHINPLMIFALLMTLVLAACGGKEVLPEGGNPIPTPIKGENVGDAPDSQAAATPEETFSRYIDDSIAALVAGQSQKLSLRARFQNPEQTEKDLGGLLSEVNILEDRTKIKKVTDTSTNATANVDIDIRVKWADGDTESFTCNYAVTLQSGENKEGETVWYVINPDAFPVFVNCTRK